MSYRILFGRDGGQYKFRVSKPGHDAFTATWPNLLFSEQQGVVRLRQSGTVVLTNQGAVLGAMGTVWFGEVIYTPFVHWSYSQDGGASYIYPTNPFADNNPSLPGASLVHIHELTSSYVTFRRPPEVPAGDLVRYVVFAEHF